MGVKVTFERRKCERCDGTGKLKGVRAKAGSRAAVGRRKLAHCPDCMGDGYHEVRTSSQVAPASPPDCEPITAKVVGRTHVIEGVEWEEI